MGIACLVCTSHHLYQIITVAILIHDFAAGDAAYLLCGREVLLLCAACVVFGPLKRKRSPLSLPRRRGKNGSLVADYRLGFAGFGAGLLLLSLSFFHVLRYVGLGPHTHRQTWLKMLLSIHTKQPLSE